MLFRNIFYYFLIYLQIVQFSRTICKMQCYIVRFDAYIKPRRRRGLICLIFLYCLRFTIIFIFSCLLSFAINYILISLMQNLSSIPSFFIVLLYISAFPVVNISIATSDLLSFSSILLSFNFFLIFSAR